MGCEDHLSAGNRSLSEASGHRNESQRGTGSARVSHDESPKVAGSCRSGPDIDRRSCRPAIAGQLMTQNARAQHDQQLANWEIVLETPGRFLGKMPLICRSFFVQRGGRHAPWHGAARAMTDPA